MFRLGGEFVWQRISLLEDTGLERLIEVLRGQVHRFVCDLAVAHDLCDVELPLADKIVALEEVTIPGLQCERLRLDRWGLHFEEETIVKAWDASCVSVVRIRLLFVVIADERFDEHVRGTLPVLHGNPCAFEDRQAYLKFPCRFSSQLPDFAAVAALGGGVDIDPHVDCALVERATLMVELSCLNRLLFDGLPFGVEEAVVQINGSLANKVIAEKEIVVVCHNNQGRCARESHVEVKSFIELRIWLVVLVVVTVIELDVATGHDQVGVARRSNVSRSKVVPLDQVQVHNRFRLSLHHLFDHA